LRGPYDTVWHRTIIYIIDGLVAELEAIQKNSEERIEGQVRIVVGVENMRRNFRETLDSARNKVWEIGTKHSPARRSDIAYAPEIISKKHLKARTILDIHAKPFKQKRHGQ
jgi:hypothetical protein